MHLYDPARPQGVPWPNPSQTSIYRTFLPADYRKIATPFGVVGMIEMECSPWVEDNYWVLDAAARDTIVVGTVGNLYPGKPDFREHLSRLHKNPLFRGIRFAYLWGRKVAEEVPKAEFISDLKALAEAGLTLDSVGGPALLQDVVQITDKVPELRVVIDHLPGTQPPEEPAARAAFEAALRELGKRPQVYVKFSEIFQRADENGRRVRSGGRIPRELSFYPCLLIFFFAANRAVALPGDAGQVQQEGVLEGGLLVALVAAGDAAVSGFHAGLQQEPVAAGLGGAEFGNPLGGLPALHLGWWPAEQFLPAWW